MKKIITISRQYGSGGREVGEKLAKKLQIPFYDNEIIDRATKASGFSHAAFENPEKKATNSLLYSIAMGMNSYGTYDMGFTQLSLDDRIYLAQADVIRKMAAEGSCIIVGRCADYILKDEKDIVNIFLWASLDYRVKRAIALENIEVEKAKETVLKNDKRRANYYSYHATSNWGKADNYHMSLGMDKITIEDAVDCIAEYVTRSQKKKLNKI